MRIRTIDACLRRRQRLWTLEDLRQACEDALYDYEGISGISTRTIQRDIELMRGDKLGYYAPIVVRERKYYTYEDPNYSITQLPLTKQDLAELSSALDIIKHYNGFQGMAGQEDILARMQDRVQTQEGHRQAIYIETNARLKGLDFLSCLYEHIVKKHPIVVDYHSFKSCRDTRFRLSPYLLKEFSNRWFLLAYNPRLDNIQTLALDRMLAVSKDEGGQYVENTFFDPASYLGEMVGVTRDLHSQTELVTLWVDAHQAPYVRTKPLHGSQQVVEEYSDGSILLTIDVILNFELERLILGYGYHIEVKSPCLLRRRISQAVLTAAANYQSR